MTGDYVSMLSSTSILAFAAATNPDNAPGFHRDVLGLRLVEESPFASVFDAGGTIRKDYQV